MNTKIILASGSPRRKEIMEKYGFSFLIRTKDTEEITDKTMPCEIVMDLAYHKALAVAKEVQEELSKGNAGSKEFLNNETIYVIGADTIVAYQNQILGKPKDRSHSLKMISDLQGKIHQVYTGVAILEAGREITSTVFYEKTDVYVKEMSRKEQEEYVNSGEGDDKAGAYAIQGIFSKYIEKFEGDYYNVVGLPMERLWQELEKTGCFMPERCGTQN